MLPLHQRAPGCSSSDIVIGLPCQTYPWCISSVIIALLFLCHKQALNQLILPAVSADRSVLCPPTSVCNSLHHYSFIISYIPILYLYQVVTHKKTLFCISSTVIHVTLASLLDVLMLYLFYIHHDIVLCTSCDVLLYTVPNTECIHCKSPLILGCFVNLVAPMSMRSMLTVACCLYLPTSSNCSHSPAQVLT